MARVFDPAVFQSDVFQIGEAGVITVTAAFSDGDDTVLAAAVVAQPAAQQLPSGRRRRRGWRYDVPTWPVMVRARVTDDDDAVRAIGIVEWSRITSRAVVRDEDDVLQSAAIVSWPAARYVRGLRPVRAERLAMIRDRAGADMRRAA